MEEKLVITNSPTCLGDGVISTSTFDINDSIFSEKPFFFLQALPNRQHALVCSCCSRFLGSVGLQMKYLQKEISRQDLSNPLDITNCVKQYQYLSEVVPCVLNCGELYCSEECKARHWSEKGHCMLCTGQIDEIEMDENPLYSCKVFAVQTNEIFLMICDIIARTIVKYESMGQRENKSMGTTYNSNDVLHLVSRLDEVDPVAAFEKYVRNLWWEAIELPKPPNKRKQLKKTLQNLVTDLWTHLNDTFHLEEKGLQTIFSKEWIARTIGMFEQNNVGVRLESPVAQFIQQVVASASDDVFVREIIAEVEKIRDAIEVEGDCCSEDEEDNQDDDEEMDEDLDEEEEMEVEDLEKDIGNTKDSSSVNTLQRIIEEVGEDNLFPPLDGTAFFLLTCKINHSCVPNVKVEYRNHPSEGLELCMKAIQPIKPGEELLQSYINQFESLGSRRKALKDYGFTCQCQKCLSETNK